MQLVWVIYQFELLTFPSQELQFKELVLLARDLATFGSNKSLKDKRSLKSPLEKKQCF